MLNTFLWSYYVKILFVLMWTELRSTKHWTITNQAMIMRLFHTVDAFSGAIISVIVIGCIIIDFCNLIWIVNHGFFHQNCARFVVSHFSKAKHSNVFQFAVMTSMSHHFVGIRTNEIAFQTMKMWWLIVCACRGKKRGEEENSIKTIYLFIIAMFT